ncbi:MAG: DUF308 domain-containing protein [Candidatus Coproplasma sp.]
MRDKDSKVPEIQEESDAEVKANEPTSKSESLNSESLNEVLNETAFTAQSQEVMSVGVEVSSNEVTDNVTVAMQNSDTHLEEEEEVTVDGLGTYGDVLVHQMSIESNVKKVHEGFKINESVVAYIMAVLYVIAGVACVIFPHEIEHVLSYVVGGAMLLGSIVQFIVAIITKEYKKTNTNKTAWSVIVMGLSVMILLLPEWGHNFVIIIWGILGLFEGARAFNHALARISRGMRCSYYIIKGIVEVSIAFLLLYDSTKYGELHIIVFGVSLALDGITVMPFWKKILDKK